MGSSKGSTSSSAKNVEATPASSEASAQKLWDSYTSSTPQNLKIIDSYLAFIMASGIIQFIYVLVVGTFPYNAFLSGFISTVGSFVLAANLRIQTNPANTDFGSISPVRAFADFVFCNIVLQFMVVNFLG
ncbi:oligosaccharyltransferase complex subunit epsilon [Entomophthora muscae]|uniref:Oligosaccharyltransferase complex subunit epsilon n=1 Tax=Entomophthora muscae TaxID=34485 RepID=A0ACC2SQ33_9FUNG|nr:oligosaccharyltransferase complex subunit epsilon [Entomophthora muscae]